MACVQRGQYSGFGKYQISAVSVLFFVHVISCTSYQPSFAVQSLPKDVMILEFRDIIELVPNTVTSDMGLMFYPGAFVAPRSYIKLLYKIAEAGYLVIIVKMPFDLAVLAPDKCLDFLEAFPGIASWVLCGHSLGGTIAASQVRKHGERFNGLILMAAYPPESDSLAASSVPVLTLYASEDGLATREKVEKAKTLLPPHAKVVEIRGGNHAGFGSYGAQPGDGAASISEEEQHRQVSEHVLDFLRSVVLVRQ